MIGAGLATARMAAVIAVLFCASPAPMTAASGHGVSHASLGRHTASNKLSRSTNLRVADERLRDQRLRKRRIAKIRALAGPYARIGDRGVQAGARSIAFSGCGGSGRERWRFYRFSASGIECGCYWG